MDRDGPVSNMIKLTVIIIGRNETAHIERCVRSVLKGVQNVPGAEIFYCDSASTDNTCDIVSRYPEVQIFQLKPDWPLSASAGRYIGYLHASGEFLFFIDGDTVLFHDWLPEGIRFIEQNPDIAAVAGSVHEIFEGPDGHPVGMQLHRYGRLDRVRKEKTMGGIALYRKSVLDSVGPFNPYLSSDEEPELGLRIRHAGYRLMRLPSIMAITYGPPRQSFSELIRRYRSGLYTFGKTLKYCRQSGHALQYIRERLDHLLSYAAAVLAGLAALVFVSVKHWFLQTVILAAAAVFLIAVFRRPLFERLVISFVKRSMMFIRTVQTYVNTTPKPVSSYPADAIEIRGESAGDNTG